MIDLAQMLESMSRTQGTAEQRGKARRPRRSRRGLTLIEAMISAALLGIGIAALVRLHSTSVSGVASGRAVTHATAIAQQRSEMLSAQVAEGTLPACPGDGFDGCRQSDRVLSPPKTCTEWLDGSEVPATDGVIATNADERGFRVDVVLAPHPSINQYPNATLAITSVCWIGTKGDVHEVQARRVLVPGS